MHWVARWGEIDNIKYLCDKGMSIFLPDMHGYIPLDYAGLFKCNKAMIYLIRKGIEGCKQQLQNFFKQDGEGPVVKPKRVNDMCCFSGPELQINPDYRSKLLYWAAYLSEEDFSWKEMQKMLKDIEPCTEYKNQIDNNKTALHVACINGHDKKARLILIDLRKRYVFGLNKSNIIFSMIAGNTSNR